jgi:hypothetical protein
MRLLINSATRLSGYMTAPTCLHAIQLGLKKSSKTGFPSVLLKDSAVSSSDPSYLCHVIPPSTIRSPGIFSLAFLNMVTDI